MNLSDWWDALSVLQKIYWVMALPSSLIFIIQLLMTLVGGDADDVDVDHDGDFDGDHGAGFHIFSVKSIISFLMVFGWSGLAVIAQGVISLWIILGISFVAGFIMMLITAWVLMLLLKLQESGTLKMENAIGEVGEVYISIPAKKKGSGKVQITVQGGLKTIDAVTEEAEDIKTGIFVEVVEIQAGDILVVRRKR